jgi:16S rRNA processing protein RimM
MGRILTDRFVVGLVGAPFGLKGCVKVRPLSGETDHLLKLTSVIIHHHNREEVLELEACSPAPPVLILKFKGIDSPEAAKALGGAELITGREHASPLKPGEYYIEDLRGLAVAAAADTGFEAGYGQNGEILGHIADVVEGGGGFLVEIRLSTGECKFVPFRPEFFAPLDLGSGRVILLNRWILE